MFLDCNSQKLWPAQQVVKASGICSPRTSGDPSLRTTAIEHDTQEQMPMLTYIAVIYNQGVAHQQEDLGIFYILTCLSTSSTMCCSFPAVSLS